jgi:hypothetical protein
MVWLASAGLCTGGVYELQRAPGSCLQSAWHLSRALLAFHVLQKHAKSSGLQAGPEVSHILEMLCLWEQMEGIWGEGGGGKGAGGPQIFFLP